MAKNTKINFTYYEEWVEMLQLGIVVDTCRHLTTSKPSVLVPREKVMGNGFKQVVYKEVLNLR